MQKLNLLYSGKAKSIYATEDADLLVMEFRNDTSAFDGERVEQLDARIGFVAIEHFVDSDIEIGGAGLGADEQFGIGGKAFRPGDLGVAGAHQHVLLGDHVGVGEIDLGLALVIDGDAIHADVILAVADGLDHDIPA